MFNPIDWHSLFFPDIPVLEIILRGSVMYLVLFILLRIVLRRQAGTLGMTDLLLITLLADASQNALTGEYNSLPAGIMLVETILFWNSALDWLSFKASWFARLIEPPPLLLVKHGNLVRFKKADCSACAARPLCTRARAQEQPRCLYLRPQPQKKMVQEAQERLASEEGKQLDKKRAGAEGTLSQGVRAFGLRQTRYRGLVKTHLQHIVTAAAMNLERIVAWVTGVPQAATRTSRFAALAA